MLSWITSIVSAIDLESPLQTPEPCTAVAMIFSIKDKTMVTLQGSEHIAQMTRFALVLLMEERVVDVWPDFLESEGAAIND